MEREKISPPGESPNQNEPSWPNTPSAIFILGKRQGTKKENKQLWGRVAMAAALWHSAPRPKPYIIFVAADVHGPQRTPDVEIVRHLLVEKFEIPLDFLILRQRANCTLVEVRQGRVLQSGIRGAKLAYLAAVRERLADARGRLGEVVPGVDYGPDGIDGQGKEEGRCEQQACHQATAVAVTDD